MVEYIDKAVVEQAVTKEAVAILRATTIDNMELVDKLLDVIQSIPVADVAPIRHGYWECTNKAYGEYRCSVCGGMDSDCADYYGSHDVRSQECCSHCGAKMDGGSNNETDCR